MVTKEIAALENGQTNIKAAVRHLIIPTLCVFYTKIQTQEPSLLSLSIFHKDNFFT